MSQQARQAVREAYNGASNFMSPRVLRYGNVSGVDQVYYELSHGTFGPDDIYGVSIVLLDRAAGRHVPDYDRSRSFSTRDEAEDYIAMMKRAFANVERIDAVPTR